MAPRRSFSRRQFMGGAATALGYLGLKPGADYSKLEENGLIKEDAVVDDEELVESAGAGNRFYEEKHGSNSQRHGVAGEAKDLK